MSEKAIPFNLELQPKDFERAKNIIEKHTFASRKELVLYLLDVESGIAQSSKEILCDFLSGEYCTRSYPTKLQKTDDALCRACQKAKKLDEEKRNPQEPKADNIGDLCNAPPCNRRAVIRGKDGVEFWCVYHRPCSPLQQTQLKSIKMCSTCKSQEYQLPNKTKISETIPQEYEQEPKIETEQTQQLQAAPKISERTYEVQPYWKPAYASMMFSDGGKWCPFKVVKVFTLDCKLCKTGYPQKYEKCGTLRKSTLQPLKPQNLS